MFNEKTNLKIDYEMIDFLRELEITGMDVDEVHFCLLAMVGANAISNPFAPYTYTTLDQIIINMAQDIDFKAKKTIRDGLLKAFNTLKTYEIIEMNEEFTGKANQVVCIDCHNVQHLSDDKYQKYIQLGRKEIAVIIKNSRVPHHLIVELINYTSRFNNLAMGFLLNNKWHSNISLQTLKHEGLSVLNFKALSTWISQETAKTTWCDGIKRENAWQVSDVQFSKYSTDLVKLGILDRLIINVDGRNLSYYFRPQYKECVKWAIEISEQQQEYMKEQEKEEENYKIIPLKGIHTTRKKMFHN